MHREGRKERWRAGEGNRTLTTSLEGWGSTVELHPRALPPRQQGQEGYPCSRAREALPAENWLPREQQWWAEQDSNLRRLSHQIYSLARLTAPEFPPFDHSTAIRASHFATPGQQLGLSATTALTSGELAVGLEPTTSGLQNRGSAD